MPSGQGMDQAISTAPEARFLLPVKMLATKSTMDLGLNNELQTINGSECIRT